MPRHGVACNGRVRMTQMWFVIHVVNGRSDVVTFFIAHNYLFLSEYGKGTDNPLAAVKIALVNGCKMVL